jgi:predicted transcriptional regulator
MPIDAADFGLDADHVWVMTSSELATKLDELASRSPPSDAALVKEAAERLRELEED